MWEHLAPDWEIRLLHYGNPNHECHIHKFIPPKDLPRTFENLTAPLSSDAVRIALMRLHGGVYMDVSIILLSTICKDLSSLRARIITKRRILLLVIILTNIRRYYLYTSNIPLILSTKTLLEASLSIY